MAATQCHVIRRRGLEKAAWSTRPLLSRRPVASATAPWRPAAVLDESVSRMAWKWRPSWPLLTVSRWVQKEARPISLRQLTFFGRTLTENRLLSSANYVRMELPTRFEPSSFSRWLLPRPFAGLPTAYAICRRCLSSLSPILTCHTYTICTTRLSRHYEG